MADPMFTLCAAAAVGVILVSVSAKLRIPPIVLLLIVGVAIGPEGVGMIDPSSLGSGLKLVVSMVVAVILFEGGLTLDLSKARQSLGVIGRMLTIGVLITWCGATLTIWWLFKPSLSIAVLCGSLVVVTGPTVVAPILRRINIRDRIRHILYWESVLVDAVGVFLAVLCFEWISPDAELGTFGPLARFGFRVGVGVGVGLVVGLVMSKLLTSHLVHDEHANIFVLGVALLSYAICETILHESGVLAVIVAGFALGARRPRQLGQLKRFKLELTELGVGTLFILLAGTLRLNQFRELGWKLIVAVVVLVAIVRPLAIFVSTWGRGYSIEERLFLSWVAPRGIVAAFLASLFALELGSNPAFVWEAQLIHTFTFAVIGATVILQGLSAPAVAKLLKLEKAPRNTWLIAGDVNIVGPISKTLNCAGVRALGLVRGPRDSSASKEGARDDLIVADPRDPTLRDDPRFADVAAVVVVTPDRYYNELVCDRWTDVVGNDHCYQWSDSSVENSDTSIGALIWAYVGTPTELAIGLESGTLVISTIDLDRKVGATSANSMSTVKPLFILRGEIAEIPTNDDLDKLDGEVAIVIRKRVPGLSGLVRDAVVITGESSNFENVIRKLLDLASTHTNELPVEAIHSMIMEREQSMSTAIGAGVAIPHAYHDAVERPQCFVASIKTGIVADTPDGQQIRLIFLVLSPRGQAEAHLKSLAAIANLSRDQEDRAILEAELESTGLLKRIHDRE